MDMTPQVVSKGGCNGEREAKVRRSNMTECVGILAILGVVGN